MGSKMVENLSRDGRKIIVYDANESAVKKVVAASAAGNKSVTAGSLSDMSQKCSIIFSMLPNDKVSALVVFLLEICQRGAWVLIAKVVESVSKSLMDANKASKSKNKFMHISCSTISPSSARRLATQHSEQGHKLITAPVFARPDGESMMVHLKCV
jgi:3-hydroxyisobutyrate dehydrogenase-like beta-hydroxyacid dehydrogenase